MIIQMLFFACGRFRCIGERESECIGECKSQFLWFKFTFHFGMLAFVSFNSQVESTSEDMVITEIELALIDLSLLFLTLNICLSQFASGIQRIGKLKD